MAFYNGRHLLSAEDIDFYTLEHILRDAQIIELMDMNSLGREELRKVLGPDKTRGRYEPYKALIYSPNDPSLRTANGSLNAMRMLGGIADPYQGQFSPYMDKVAGPKDESLLSVARTAAAYRYDMFLIRNDRVRREEDSFRVLADKCDKLHLPFPIVSMGEGDREHPLQMFADLGTIKESKEDLLRTGRLNIGFIGDVECSRTFHSLAIGLAYYGGVINMISPPGNVFPASIWAKVERLNQAMILQRGQPNSILLPEDTLAKGKGKLVRRDVNDLFTVISKLDVLVWARLQKNLRNVDVETLQRMEAEYETGFFVNDRVLNEMSEDAINVHSLPHAGQFPEKLDLDEDPRFLHWRGVKIGLYTKAAAFTHVLRGYYPFAQRWREIQNAMARAELEKYPKKAAV